MAAKLPTPGTARPTRAGGVWVAGDGAASPIAGVPAGEPGEVPALAIEHPDVRVVAASDGELPGAGDRGPRADTSGGVAWQVFRRPGDHGSRPDQIYLHIEALAGADPAALEAVFLYGLWDRRTATLEDDVRSVEVPGRPALLVGETGPEPELLWLHTTSATVDLRLPPGDPATLDALVAGIHELTPDQWSTLRTTVGEDR